MKGMYYWIPAKIKLRVAKRDKGICKICGLKASTATVNRRGLLEFKTKDGQTYHYDHIKPVAQGGMHTANNLRLSCPTCNLSKRKQRIANDVQVKKILLEFSKARTPEV